MSETIFWVSLIFIVYTYFIYPVLIWLLSQTRSVSKIDITDDFEYPKLSIVIPVYNEKNNIEEKIKNIKSLDYPKNKIEIILVSDGSDDGTQKIFNNDDRVTFLSYEKRQGKPSALNFAVKHVATDIIVFTDIRQAIDKYAVKFLVKRLMIPGVGAVSGELCHKPSKSNIGKNVGLYWLYEKWIRKSESRFNSTAGVTGALYAIHTSDYVPLNKDTLLDDFEVPIQLVKNKQRVVLESQAKIYDTSQEDIAGEKKRKIRTLTGNFQSFLWNKWLFNPFKNPIIFQFLSHKLFRLIVPYTMLLTLVSSFYSDGFFYVIIFWCQVLFYMLGIIGMNAIKFKNYKIISIIVVFLELNISAVLALNEFLRGKVKVQWDKTS
ncbi:Glycosyl transferase, group 2 family [hydrothermal vent metagenome]|uniref:Glycosyl transferase, group 2 family n=1 Tax=hydrothermal vent metagenome TaxID=652676 RepID=A0A3B0ZK13_9ZZZZ